ncbi:response regulator [Allorhodopirellula heiligendammensis]|uniref:Phosphate regulon transcriptional regulatory protein PhoB n=1 Tax=Allorhodopirellula heiligendammensis TaxID=2714739 RepID=A0A5C6C3N7_9BACT|nr:response regulator [Allorhodopirellula heiligendammensis]TWU18221.1 Phosphate regulon transcriptional regulatory protein PhoB [Allorhodopirellula heiligendammensis]|tara:strand:- start:3459 stop:4205 length:747 start_codon:yes stop_codon:yes gene_type:complete
MAKPTVLLIEDDHSLAEIVAYNLQREGYEVLLATDGEDGLRQAKLKLPGVVILDLMLPVLDGLEVCRRLRADPATAKVRVLMLTAKAEETDQLIGFSLGADDYVTKPFSVKVLMERVKSLCRRETQPPGESLVENQGIRIDPVRHSVTIHGEPVRLTRSEFRLLESLIRQPGRVFSRFELIDAALGDDTLVLERTIDVHVRSLRKKMGENAHLIETVRGVGYNFRDSAKASSWNDDQLDSSCAKSTES